MDYLNGTDFQNKSIAEETKTNFASLGQWMFIGAIMGFVGIALSLITTVISYNKMSSFGLEASSIAMSQVVVSVVTICISLFLNITLLNAARKLKTGLASMDQSSFAVGLNKLAMYFKIIGILIIIGLVLLGVGIIFGGLSSAMR